MENFDNEQWRDIDGYEGMYQVSDFGRVRSIYSGEWKVLRPGTTPNGYLMVNLWKDGKGKSVMVHRLVAQSFIQNDDERKTFVNHIDECKQNNIVDNIEYCTAQYNNTYNDLHYRRRHPNYRRNAIKDLYDPNLSVKQNIELFRANGIECSERTVWQLRKDLGITRKYTKRS